MNLTEGLDSLQNEIATILNTNLPAQRRHYYEGARDYLATLKRLLEEGEKQKRPRLPKRTAAKPETS